MQSVNPDFFKFNPKLPSRVYTDWRYALDMAQSLGEGPYHEREPVPYHVSWREGLPFGRKQAACLKSIITTQNMENIRLHFWCNNDVRENEWYQGLDRWIEFHLYDPVKEAIGTPLEGMENLLRAKDHLGWLDGDLFRLLILYKYGGVYADTDVLFLRDLAPILPYEFMYQWGTETDKINGAVMRMHKGSTLGRILLGFLPHVPASAASTDWSSTLYSAVRCVHASWFVFPCAWFNTEWQNGINMGESGHPFKNGNDSDKDFPGAFTWHWHNKWDAPIEEGSKFQRLEERIIDAYAKKFNYMVDRNRLWLGGNYGGGDSASFTPALWAELLKSCNVKTVLDVGCGQGYSSRWFANNGCDVIAFDGLEWNKDHNCMDDIYLHDLQDSPFSCQDVDLAWCCEVAEHLEAEYVQNLIETLSRGRFVAMTAARPGQSGFHHVNCQSPEYWIKLMEGAGYYYDDRITEHLREIAEDGWFKKQGLFFIRKI